MDDGRRTMDGGAHSLFLGIDGGASKTIAVVVDAAGREVGRGLAGPANHTAVGADRAAAQAWDAAQGAATQAGVALPLRRAWVGLAGAGRPAGRTLMQPLLAGLANHVRLTGDGALALGALGAAGGVALIAGTGSLALGTDGLGGEVVVGGWGHALGDEGSGYDLGRRGVIAALRAADGRSVPTTLLPMLLAAWGIGEPADIVGRVYGTHPADLAAIAPLVFQAAWQGDRAAQRIVARGAAELARCALAAATKLRLPHGSLPLALAGSLLIRHPGYRNLVLAAIRRHRPLGTTVLVDDPALTAACWAAQAE